MNISFVLNGKNVKVEDVPGDETLLALIRDRLSLMGTKEGCGVGECGACTVLLDGRAVNSCLTAAGGVHGREVTTIEGLADNGRPHPIQEAFIESGAVQCGFCSPGMILAAYSLLSYNPEPSDDDIKTSMAGNLCRCTGYSDVIKAVKRAAQWLREER